MTTTQLNNTYSTPPDAKWPDAAQLMLNGIHAKVESDRIDTWRKRGVYRGGSAGVVLENGAAAGTCIRAAAARFAGAEPERDPAAWAHKQLMFEAGFTNEDSWFDALVRSNWGGSILREEEFPITWDLDGVKGTGREDIILCDADRRPICLLELKLVCSLNTAIDVLLRARPKLEHAIQLGNYMLRTQLPGVIAYVNRVDIAVPDWGFIQPHLPKRPEDTTHHAAGYCQWSHPQRAANGKPGKPPKVTKLTQFVVRYRFRWAAGRLEWQPFESTRPDWVKTPITADGIDAFYRATSGMLTERRLPPPKSVVEIDGSRGSYNACHYCDHNYLCSRVGDDFEAWLEHVKSRADEAGELAAEADAVVKK